MAIGSILLGLALLVLVALYLARPLFKSPVQTAEFANRRRQLEEEYEAHIDGIRALDFDHETGKLPTEVYEQQRAQLRIEAAAVLKELEKLPAAGDDAYSQIEAAVAAKRHQYVAAGNGQVGFCSQCGQPLDPDDKFCSHCGQPTMIATPST